MFFFNSEFYGMHFLWWVFWGMIWVSLFSFWMPVPRRRLRDLKEPPLDILKRRLATGEINEQQYASLKAHLESDKRQEFPASPIHST